MTNEVHSVRWSPSGDAIRIIDQRDLPDRTVERDLRTVDDVADAIRSLAVRGAPAIGIAGAMGVALGARLAAEHSASGADVAAAAMEAAGVLRATRPTAVNLPAALDRMLRRVNEWSPGDGDLAALLIAESTAILEEEREMCRRIGEHALSLFPESARVVTHCNAGALATAGIGTALAPIYLAAEQGRSIEVFVGETRPLMQGSRLTAWELAAAKIPVTVVADGAMMTVIRDRGIDCCIVGADRIAANGDVANKIGTYAIAVAAKHHGIPFYVAAPSSTIDGETPNGEAMTIEERAPDELRKSFGRQTVADGARILNPAFDVTPAELITAIITDRGVHRAPYRFASHEYSAPREAQV